MRGRRKKTVPDKNRKKKKKRREGNVRGGNVSVKRRGNGNTNVKQPGGHGVIGKTKGQTCPSPGPD